MTDSEQAKRWGTYTVPRQSLEMGSRVILTYVLLNHGNTHLTIGQNLLTTVLVREILFYFIFVRMGMGLVGLKKFRVCLEIKFNPQVLSFFLFIFNFIFFKFLFFF